MRFAQVWQATVAGSNRHGYDGRVTTTFSIRPATAADASPLAELRWDFRVAEAGAAAESHAEFVARCREWMEPRLAPGSAWRCWLAEVDGAIAGNLWLQVIEKIPNPVPEPESHVYITNVYVAPGYRGGGVGAGLVRTAIDYAREIEADSAILWPTEKSRTLYQRFGFELPPDLLQAVVTPGRDIH